MSMVFIKISSVFFDLSCNFKDEMLYYKGRPTAGSVRLRKLTRKISAGSGTGRLFVCRRGARRIICLGSRFRRRMPPESVSIFWGTPVFGSAWNRQNLRSPIQTIAYPEMMNHNLQFYVQKENFSGSPVKKR